MADGAAAEATTRRATLLADARRLLREARAGALATCADGQPHASLVTPAPDADGSLLMLLSGLSDHTGHLEADPRCSVIVGGAQAAPNPQTMARLSLIGRAERVAERSAKLRWLSRHPYAAFYADLGDFGLWRLVPEHGQYVGGFGLAGRFEGDVLRSPPAAVVALAAAEPELLARWNRDHPDRLAAIARHAGSGRGEWRLATIDPDGVDLVCEERCVRAHFAAPVADWDGTEAALAALAARRRA